MMQHEFDMPTKLNIQIENQSENQTVVGLT